MDYKKLNNNLLDHLVARYPEGYQDDDIITFKNSNNEIYECVEVKTNDTVYLVKISKRLATAMENYEADEAEEDNDDSEEIVSDPDLAELYREEE